jgi:hypothetical protein
MATYAASTPGFAQRAIRTSAEKFWYVLMCIYFGAGYFAKIPAKAALRDAGLCQLTGWETFWYVIENIPFGAGYLHKVIIKKAMSEAGLVQP